MELVLEAQGWLGDPVRMGKRKGMEERPMSAEPGVASGRQNANCPGERVLSTLLAHPGRISSSPP